MTREEASSAALEGIKNSKCVILQLGTGFGKTKLAIDCANAVCDKVYNNEKESTTILIVVNRNVHKEEWKKQISEWGGIKTENDHIIITTYASLHKYRGYAFDCVIFDEAQHLSERCRDVLKDINIGYNLICLSGTLPRKIKDWLTYNYSTTLIVCDIAQAIEDEVLPSPTIYLLPLTFDSFPSECIYKNVGKGLPKISCSWIQRWQFLRRKDIELTITCTKSQYLQDLNSQILYWEKKKSITWGKTKYLRLCGERLKWLARIKSPIILSLLQELKNYRTLTFCKTIEQAEILGKNCIHSKNSQSQELINKFNEKKIKHIVAVDMLNECANLTDCRIGIFANYNGSEVIGPQRMGRILRHKHPIIIMPFYKNTREEELVKKYLEGYSPELIKTITNINEIKL